MKKPLFVIEGKEVQDIRMEESVTTEYGGFCSTCFSEDYVYLSDLQLKINNEWVSIGKETRDYDSSSPMSTADLIKVFTSDYFLRSVGDYTLDTLPLLVGKVFSPIIGDYATELLYTIDELVLQIPTINKAKYDLLSDRIYDRLGELTNKLEYSWFLQVTTVEDCYKYWLNKEHQLAENRVNTGFDKMEVIDRTFRLIHKNN